MNPKVGDTTKGMRTFTPKSFHLERGNPHVSDHRPGQSPYQGMG